MGGSAECVLYSYLVIFQICQLIIQQGDKATSTLRNIACDLKSLMSEKVIFCDLVFVVCFHDYFFKAHLDWLMQSKDLTKPAFQAHQILVRFHLIDKDLKSRMKQHCEDLAVFAPYVHVLTLLSEEDAELQRVKIDGFLKQDMLSLHNHFSVYASPLLLGAGLLAEKPLAGVPARVILNQAPDEKADEPYCDQPGGKFYSKVHKRHVSLCEFDAFVRQKFNCLLYTSPSPRDLSTSRMPSSA